MLKTVIRAISLITVIVMILTAVLLYTFFLDGSQSKMRPSASAASESGIDTVKVVPLKGEIIFKYNCSSCHSPHEVVVGPALAKITERQSKVQIRKWIRNSQRLVFVEKDKYAIDLYEKFNRIPMTSFPALTDKEIDDILFYVENSPQPSYRYQVLPEVISCP